MTDKNWPAELQTAPTSRANEVSQATAVEQSRAVAEVQAAVIIAQNRPRDIAAAISRMRETCRQPMLAERAFFRFPRAGQTVTGPSIHLAKALAQCWGNIKYGYKELRRDDARGESEMMAFAWDMEANSLNELTVVVPHFRDTKSGPKKLTDRRDIYENNANNAARRLRECIYSVLPTYFTEEAKAVCHKTITEGVVGDGQPLQVVVANMVEAYAKIGVTAEDLSRKVGRPTSQFTVEDVTQLRVIFNSIRQGEIDKHEEFGRPAPGGHKVLASAATAPNKDPFAKERAAAKPASTEQKAPPTTAQPDDSTPATETPPTLSIVTPDGEVLAEAPADEPSAILQAWERVCKGTDPHLLEGLWAANRPALQEALGDDAAINARTTMERFQQPAQTKAAPAPQGAMV